MKDQTIYLQHILAAIGKIESYLSQADEARFRQEELLQDGVIRQLEIIGEAANGLSNEVRAEHSHIPWRSITGMRNKLIHAYFAVDLTEVWRTTQDDLPFLKQEVEKTLQQLQLPFSGLK